MLLNCGVGEEAQTCFLNSAHLFIYPGSGFFPLSSIKTRFYARTGASQGFPRAAAPVGVFSRGTQASPGETRPRRTCEGLGAPSHPPLLPEARPQNHSLRGSRSPPSWSGSRSAAAAGQELVALRAALAELRCWGVELAEGSRRPRGRLLLPARCYGS